MVLVLIVGSKCVQEADGGGETKGPSPAGGML